MILSGWLTALPETWQLRFGYKFTCPICPLRNRRECRLLG